MNEKVPFGEISANDLKVGDIVEWSNWDPEIDDWGPNYGVIMEIKNEIKGNRMISVSIVVPVVGPITEMEFFTPSLRLVSRANVIND